MRVLLLCSVLLLAGCANAPVSYFPAANDLPDGWSYAVSPRDIEVDMDGDFPVANTNRTAELTGPSGTASILVMTYGQLTTAAEAEADARRYGCDDDDMTHMLVDDHHLVFIGTWEADEPTTRDLRALRNTIAATTGADIIC